MNGVLRLLVVVLAGLATPLAGAPHAGAQPKDPPATTAPAIATRAEATDDADIALRIRTIFGEIVAFKDVRVRVSAGVVTLTGTTLAVEDKARAEGIAARVAGVVTVQNDLVRDLDVGTKVAPALVQVKSGARDAIRALPLFGVALAAGLFVALIGFVLASRTRILRWVAPNNFLAELLPRPFAWHS